MTAVSARRITPRKPGGLIGLIRALQNIQIGGAKNGPGGPKIPRKELTFLLSNLVTLIENGVSLRKALETIAQEESLAKYADLFETLLKRMEAGESFSTGLSQFPATFDSLMVHQIRVGERSGAVATALRRIVEQLEKGNKLRSLVIKRLSYPAIVAVAGSGVITFMVLYIIPVFQKTYAEAKVPLPFITQSLVTLSKFMLSDGWLLPVALVAAFFAYRKLRKRPAFSLAVDRALLRVPLLGDWLRDIAVLQFMEVLGTMMESGFKVVDALGVSADSIGNHAVKRAVTDLQTAVVRGERFSQELHRHGDLFPPVVSQLVIVGEQTGKLANTTKHIREHLEQQIERKTEVAVGTLEPMLTATMAVAIGFILMAIYLPMFDMINVVNKK